MLELSALDCQPDKTAFAYVTNATFANVWDNEDAAEYDRL